MTDGTQSEALVVALTESFGSIPWDADTSDETCRSGAILYLRQHSDQGFLLYHPRNWRGPDKWSPYEKRDRVSYCGRDSRSPHPFPSLQRTCRWTDAPKIVAEVTIPWFTYHEIFLIGRVRFHGSFFVGLQPWSMC